MLRRMVPVTYLFVVLFGERTWANELAFAAWQRSARSTIELEGTAWAARYVLLCLWGESATKFTMNVSIKTSCFRSKTPPESSCRQSRPDRFSASRGCKRSCTCTGLQVRQFWVFCESVPRQILLPGLPVLPGAATGTQVLQFDKKSGAYHISFNHQRSTKSPSQTQKCM